MNQSFRLSSRILVLLTAVKQSLRLFGKRHKPTSPGRILIAHHLLLGDTLTLTPLLSKLRECYPDSDIVMATPKAYVQLYKNRPYGIDVYAYDPRDITTVRNLITLSSSGYDLAIIPGDNRYSWLARALSARWIIAFSGDRPGYKNWLIDEFIDYPDTPFAWGDIVTTLIPGSPPSPYDKNQWPMPPFKPFQRPSSPYCVLHVGASRPLKLWHKEHWQELAEHLTLKGYQVVWSGGPCEQHLIDQIDPEGKYISYAEQLTLSQLWHLLAHADLLVCPDTGIAHLGRITETPTVALFGPGSAQLSGAGEFWRNSPYISVSQRLDCRNQNLLFRREIKWLNNCNRNQNECKDNICMTLISVKQVLSAIEKLL